MNCNCGRACAAKLASFKRHDGQLLNKPLCKHSEVAAGMSSKSSKAVSNTYAGQQQKVAIKKTIALGCIAQLSGGTTFSSGVPVSLGPSSTGPSCVSSSTGAVCEAFPDGCPTSFSGECSACCTQKQEDRHKHKKHVGREAAILHRKTKMYAHCNTWGVGSRCSFSFKIVLAASSRFPTTTTGRIRSTFANFGSRAPYTWLTDASPKQKPFSIRPSASSRIEHPTASHV